MARTTGSARGVRLAARPLLLFAVALAFTVAAAALVASCASAQKTLAACGGERWTVKTLQDRPRLLPVQDTTLAYLVSRRAPHALPDTRLPFERHIFRVRAAVTVVGFAHDRDLHFVLRDGERTMIAESPSPSCTKRATPTHRRQMADARKRVRVCARAVVVGVAFFDFLLGQTGVAPNGIELHPVLAFRCETG